MDILEINELEICKVEVDNELVKLEVLNGDDDDDNILIENDVNNKNKIYGNVNTYQYPEMKCVEIYLNSIGEFYHLCLICNVKINDSDELIKHLQEHFSTAPFSCFMCDRKYKYFDIYIQHINQHNNSCTTCGTADSDELDKIDNEQHVPLKPIQIKNEKLNESGLELPNNNNNGVTINDKQETYDLLDFLSESISKKTDFDSSSCLNKIEFLDDDDCSNSVYSTQYLNESIEDFECDVSNQEVEERSNEINDEQDLSESQSNYSNRKIVKKKNLERKVSGTKSGSVRKNYKSDLKNAICHYCGKVFTKGNLKQHFSVHTKEKKYTCDICGKSFTQSNYIKLHKRIHFNEKPLECNFCGEHFRTTSVLSMHVKRHLNVHDHHCEICGKTFARLRALKNHILIHTGAKPHKCEICGVSFRMERTLLIHKRLHTGEKPYKCDHCNKTFTQYAGLYGHKKTIQNKLKPSELNVSEIYYSSEID